MSHVLVLGGGWVGTAVARVAAAHGRVTVVDPPLDPRWRDRDDDAIDALRTTIGDGGVTAVINACGRVRGADNELDDANHRFVAWLVEAMAPTGARLVHVGSASEYGDPGSAAPVHEATPARPVGGYATTKALGTDVALDAGRTGQPVCVARVFNIVDHPIPAVSPLHEWLDALRELGPEGGDIEVWWPPTTRDFVMLEDVARALVELATSDAAPPPLINVCSGVGLRFGDVVEAMAQAVDVDATVRSLDRPGIEAVVGDSTLLRRTLGWVPAMSAAALAARVTATTAGGPAERSR
ncbi:MAG: NAD-dependent epimerase/dehydratase family protein [Microthrixaceae bacterium]